MGWLIDLLRNKCRASGVQKGSIPIDFRFETRRIGIVIEKLGFRADVSGFFLRCNGF